MMQWLQVYVDSISQDTAGYEIKASGHHHLYGKLEVRLTGSGAPPSGLRVMRRLTVMVEVPDA